MGLMKTKTTFVCQECGYDTPKFMGKCPECGSWNSLKEMRFAKSTGQSANEMSVIQTTAAPQNLTEIAYSERSRLQTKYNELNTVLGGGIVKGSAMLIAGDPGVGKSTLLLQLCISLAEAGNKILYISGEESAEQIKLRAERISRHSGEARLQNQKNKDSGQARMTDTAWHKNVLLLSTTDPDAAINHIDTIAPDLIIVDSIQTMQTQNIAGLSGSVAQVRYSALHFIRIAKVKNIPLFLVGHVTKEGMVAGPMVLSHMVDTVLFLEGEKFAKTRILRSLKNRFGPVDEVGVFMMEEEGMIEVTNPEHIFLSPDANISSPGSVLASTLEGSRAFLVEIQALAVSSKLMMPRRVVSGLDGRRVELLLAVLQKHARLPVDSMDIFVNVAGGLKLTDPGVDLAVCLAVLSSIKNIPLAKTVGIGEVGLLGELRNVSGIDKRIREAQKLGYKSIITAKTKRTIRDVIDSLSNDVK